MSLHFSWIPSLFILFFFFCLCAFPVDPLLLSIYFFIFSEIIFQFRSADYVWSALWLYFVVSHFIVCCTRIYCYHIFLLLWNYAPTGGYGVGVDTHSFLPPIILLDNKQAWVRFGRLKNSGLQPICCITLWTAYIKSEWSSKTTWLWFSYVIVLDYLKLISDYGGHTCNNFIMY